MSSTTAVSGERLIRSGGRLDIDGEILRDGFLDILQGFTAVFHRVSQGSGFRWMKQWWFRCQPLLATDF